VNICSDDEKTLWLAARNSLLIWGIDGGAGLYGINEYSFHIENINKVLEGSVFMIFKD